MLGDYGSGCAEACFTPRRDERTHLVEVGHGGVSHHGVKIVDDREVSMTAESDRARDAADTAAEAIRVLNHATLHTDEFVIGDVYTIVGALATGQHRLHQAAQQLAAIVAERATRAQLGHDDGADPQPDVAAASALIASIGELADQAGQLLGDAQNRLAAISDQPVTADSPAS